MSRGYRYFFRESVTVTRRSGSCNLYFLQTWAYACEKSSLEANLLLTRDCSCRYEVLVDFDGRRRDFACNEDAIGRRGSTLGRFAGSDIGAFGVLEIHTIVMLNDVLGGPK